MRHSTSALHFASRLEAYSGASVLERRIVLDCARVAYAGRDGALPADVDIHYSDAAYGFELLVASDQELLEIPSRRGYFLLVKKTVYAASVPSRATRYVATSLM